MKAANSICRRCHRLRAVSAARYCSTCAGELRAEERRRPVAQDAEVARVLTPSLAPPVDAAVAAAASTLPPAAAPDTIPPPAAVALPPPPPGDPEPPAAVRLLPDVIPAFLLPTMGDEPTDAGIDS